MPELSFYAIAILGLYLLFVNLIAFLLFGIDKKRAQRHRWRIREKTLFLFAYLGGGMGAWIAMNTFHHKTKHWYFRVFIPVSVILWTAILLFLLVFS